MSSEEKLGQGNGGEEGEQGQGHVRGSAALRGRRLGLGRGRFIAARSGRVAARGLVARGGRGRGVSRLVRVLLGAHRLAG